MESRAVRMNCQSLPVRVNSSSASNSKHPALSKASRSSLKAKAHSRTTLVMPVDQVSTNGPKASLTFIL